MKLCPLYHEIAILFLPTIGLLLKFYDSFWNFTVNRCVIRSSTTSPSSNSYLNSYPTTKLSFYDETYPRMRYLCTYMCSASSFKLAWFCFAFSLNNKRLSREELQVTRQVRNLFYSIRHQVYARKTCIAILASMPPHLVRFAENNLIHTSTRHVVSLSLHGVNPVWIFISFSFILDTSKKSRVCSLLFANFIVLQYPRGGINIRKQNQILRFLPKQMSFCIRLSIRRIYKVTKCHSKNVHQFLTW